MGSVASQTNSLCQNCAAIRFCLPVGLSKSDLTSLGCMISRRHQLQRGEYLLQRGAPFKNFFAVQQGSLKSYTVNTEGREQIWGFYFLGELLGFEGIDPGEYPYTVCALENSVICEIPYGNLLNIAAEIPELQKQLLKLISQRCVVDHFVSRNNTAQQRLACFFLGLSQRFNRHGLNPNEFHISISRQDIANYLGLTVETVSRLLGRFKEDALLVAHGKTIKIDDFDQLKAVAGI